MQQLINDDEDFVFPPINIRDIENTCFAQLTNSANNINRFLELSVLKEMIWNFDEGIASDLLTTKILSKAADVTMCSKLGVLFVCVLRIPIDEDPMLILCSVNTFEAKFDTYIEFD